MQKQQPRVLMIIMDGWGLTKPYPGNAIALAKTPTYDRLWASAPHAVFAASGESVGLPEGQMGTSEANHFTMGAGRVVFQDLVRINRAIKDNTFLKNPAFLAAFEHVKKNSSTLHIKGLMGGGGVHAHQDHVKALIRAAKENGVNKIFIHVFTDGMDTNPNSATEYIKDLEKFLQEIGVGKIVSVIGRFYAMDRDHNWDRIDEAFDLLTQRKGHKYKSAAEAIKAAYERGENDTFVKPSIIETDPNDQAQISTNDAVIFVNFRSDRPRELVERFIDKGPQNLHYVTMTQYNPSYAVKVAFPPEKQPTCLGEILSNAGIKQLRITETEKAAHLTFFMNAKKEEAFEGEDRYILDSYSDVKTHDLKPFMRTPDIAQHIIEDMRSEAHQVIVSNWCNADMVGHTGNLAAVIKGCETVDQALSQVLPVAQAHGYDVIVTADHGNAEEMIDEKNGSMLTQHTTNPVPFIVISDRYSELKHDEGSLIDVAPTILAMLGLPIPKDMTGTSLI